MIDALSGKKASNRQFLMRVSAGLFEQKPTLYGNAKAQVLPAIWTG